jgi:HSP20 family molecular chaperone IbpA
MSGSRKKTGRAALDGIDAGLGDLLGTLGAALEDVIGRLDPGGAGEVRRDLEFDTDRGPIRAHAGIRVRVGGLDAARDAAASGRKPARPLRETAAPAPVPERPIVGEVVDDGRVWRLTADLPGISRDDLDLSLEDGMLAISATVRARRYADRIAVPPGTTIEALRVTLQNGILEIEAPSAGPSR